MPCALIELHFLFSSTAAWEQSDLVLVSGWADGTHSLVLILDRQAVSSAGMKASTETGYQRDLA